MTSILEIANRLLELEGKASPAPWKGETASFDNLDSEEPFWTIYDSNHSAVIVTDCGFYPPEKHDANFIIESRNHLRPLLEALKQAHELIETYSGQNKMSETNETLLNRFNRFRDDARAWLKKWGGV
jgi:hypothetical protein